MGSLRELCLPFTVLIALSACVEAQEEQGLTAASSPAPVLDAGLPTAQPGLLSPEREALLALAAAELRAGESLVDLLVDCNEDVLASLADFEELARESARESLDDDQRQYLNTSYVREVERLDKAAWMTSWEGHHVTDGRAATLPVPLPRTVQERLTGELAVELVDLRTTVLGFDTATIDLSTATSAQSALDHFPSSTEAVLGYRGRLDANDGVLSGALERVLARLGEERESTGDPIIDVGRARLEANVAMVEEMQGNHAETRRVIDRMVALAEQAAAGGDDDRVAASEEYTQLVDEHARLVQQATFDGAALHDGAATMLDLDLPESVEALGIGRLRVSCADLRSTVLGFDTGSVSLDTEEEALAALDQMQGSLDHLAHHEVMSAADLAELQAGLDRIDRLY